jgi:ATP/maltotriose-dependent transcriptional regulator MalT
VRRKVPGLFVLLSAVEEAVVEKNVQLTAREAQVLRLIARGCTYAAAAERLGVSAHTVRTHVKNSAQSSFGCSKADRHQHED